MTLNELEILADMIAQRLAKLPQQSLTLQEELRLSPEQRKQLSKERSLALRKRKVANKECQTL